MSVAAYLENVADLKIITAQHAITPFASMMLWRWDNVQLRYFDLNEDFSLWEQGIVFGDNSQIRWRRLSQSFRVVLISDAGKAEGWTNAQNISPVQTDKNSREELSVFLWGIKQSKGTEPVEWYEPRIPHVITGEMGYPLKNPTKDRVALTVKRYELHESTVAAQSFREKFGMQPLAIRLPEVSYLERFVKVVER